MTSVTIRRNILPVFWVDDFFPEMDDAACFSKMNI